MHPDRTYRRQAKAAIRLLAALAILATFPATAAAQNGPASAWAETEQTAVRLIAATTAVGQRESLPLGLEFKLDPGWKIYWRSPGDAGFPPRPDWSGSENLESATLRWPAPERFSVLGLETLGYKDAVVLPLDVVPATPGEPVRLRGKVDYLTCDDICIPYTAELALDLPAGDAAPSEFVHLIDRHADRVPGDGSAHGLSIESVTAPGGGVAKSLRVVATSAVPFEAPDVFVEGPVELIFDKPSFEFADGGMRATATLALDGVRFLEKGLIETALTVTLADGPRSAERTITPAVGSSSSAEPVSLSIATVLGLALLGGLILNLMPCVLPVLSIKLLGIVGQGGRAARDIRLGFLASAAGIVTSFLVLAGGLIAVKAAGGTIGWGIQFQQPWFLIAMGLIVILFAANLWGFFEIRLPSALAGVGTGERNGLAGHFLTGAFATLLATPCSAPFLGTAVGFALSRGYGEILWVFAALGIGLALPYLAVAAVPAVARLLPRPGPWMVVLRRVLGVALAGTALWLITVLAGVIGGLAAGAVGFLMAVMVGFLAAGKKFGGIIQRATALAVAALAVVALAVPVTAGSGRFAPPNGKFSELWQPFAPETIADLVADGRTVFVDVTADWCVTCQVNKAFVLGRDGVMGHLTAANVVAMQGDWTRPDEAISRYLAGFGRYGIPFDAVYGPGAPEGVLLPELLTEQAVIDAFAKAAGG